MLKGVLMSRVFKSVGELVGNTPLLELSHIEKEYDLQTKVLAKLEYFNPAGSVKDRVARAIIDDAESKGLLKHGATIIEATSGNTGIGLACVGCARGYKVVIVMPETMSVERRKLMLAYGASLVLTDGAKGMKGAIGKRTARANRRKYPCRAVCQFCKSESALRDNRTRNMARHGRKRRRIRSRRRHRRNYNGGRKIP